MLQKVLFWFGLCAFAVGQFFVTEVVEYAHLAGGRQTAYVLVVAGLGLIAGSNLVKEKR